MQLGTGGIPLISNAVLYRAVFVDAEFQKSPSVEGVGDGKILGSMPAGKRATQVWVPGFRMVASGSLRCGAVHRGYEDGMTVSTEVDLSYPIRVGHVPSSRGFRRKESLMKLSSLGVVVINFAISDRSSLTSAKKASASSRNGARYSNRAARSQRV